MCGADPGFGGDQVEGETDPEGGAEEFTRGEMGEAAGGEEDADDGADGGYREPDGKGADHPLAVQCNFATTNVPEGFAEREEEERTEESSGSGLVHAADRGHGEAHDECGDADDEGAADEHAPAEAMPPQMAGPDGGAELQRPENHEEDAGNNVNEREIWIAGEDVVQAGKLRDYRIGRRWRGTIAVQDDGQDVSDSASGYGNAYEGEEDDGDPEGVAQATAVLHIE